MERLLRAGISVSEAYYIVEDFCRCYGVQELEEYVSSVEEDAYVAVV